MFPLILSALACFFASALGDSLDTEQVGVEYTGASCVGINAISPKCRTRETPYSRDFFYIGGRYQFDEALNSSILVDQMYVEKLTPYAGATKPYPIVLFTAGVPSGAVCAACPPYFVAKLKWFLGMA